MINFHRLELASKLPFNWNNQSIGSHRNCLRFSTKIFLLPNKNNLKEMRSKKNLKLILAASAPESNRMYTITIPIIVAFGAACLALSYKLDRYNEEYQANKIEILETRKVMHEKYEKERDLRLNHPEKYLDFLEKNKQ